MPAESVEGTAAATNGQPDGFVSKLTCPQCGQLCGSFDDVMSHLASEHPQPVASNGKAPGELSEEQLAKLEASGKTGKQLATRARTSRRPRFP